MTLRVGIDASIKDDVLQDFPGEAQLVRIPEQPEEEIAVDFWVPGMPPGILKRQLARVKGVKVVQLPWAGVDSLRELFPRNVTVCNARGVHDIPTAEWALAAILAMQRSLPFYVDLQRQGYWRAAPQESKSDAQSGNNIQRAPRSVEIADSTVLIVGYGAIGQAIEARLAPFGAKFLRVARTARQGVEPVSKLDGLLGQADVVVLMLPLTSGTTHLIDAARLAKMKPGALLVNVARGAIVETDALLQALTEGRIRAAVDVTDPEPLPAGHPLWKAPNLLITPHVASDSSKFIKRAFRLVSEQVRRYVRGEPLLNVVSGEY